MSVSINYSKKTTSLVESGINNPAVVPFHPQADTLTYEPFFGLNEKPFSLSSDPRFVYESPTYGTTRERLLGGIRRREGLLVLTGEIGTGKTTLCRNVLRDLGRRTYSSMVPDPFASREDLLKMLLIDFGVLSIQDLTSGRLQQASRTELVYLLGDFLDSLAADAFAVAIIDEAQNLSLPLIEETRILADTFGADGRLQIVFVGQPELHAKLKLPEMRQVDQRVCGYHRLAPMSREAVAGYIQHRLLVAGVEPDRVLFPPQVVDALHRRSGGVPRLINRVCDRALHLARDRNADCVDQELLETALLEIGSATLSPTWDAIIFAQPVPPPAVTVTPAVAAVVPVAPPAAPAAAAVKTAPLLEDDENFDTQIDKWVEKDLVPPSRALTSLPVFADPPKRRSVGRREVAAPHHLAGAPYVTTDWPRDVRAETYMQKVRRTWARRAAIAAVAFVSVMAALAGASLLPVSEAPAATLAALPELDVRPLTPLVPLAAAVREEPVSGMPRGGASVSAAAVAGDYLVAVGLFASRERADQLVDALTQAGLPAMQRPFQLRRQEMQQIVLGPFFSRSEAVAELQRLRALGGYDDARVIGAAQ